MTFTGFVSILAFITAIGYSLGAQYGGQNYEVVKQRLLKAIFWVLASVFLTLRFG